MRLEGQYNGDTLIAMGAKTVRNYGSYVEVEPDIDISGYEAAYIVYHKGKKLNQLKACTRECITSDSPNEKRMPEWRQIRWMRYADMYEKKAGGGTLSARETAEYNSMIGASETELSVYNDCVAAINWMGLCIAANDAMEAQIKACTNITELDAIDLTTCPYPAWEDWGLNKAYIKT